MGAEKKWLFTLFSAAMLSLFLILVFSISAFSSPGDHFPSLIHRGPHHPPAFAYYIFGGRSDKDQIFRLFLAVYHPRNRYLLHLGAEASDNERRALAAEVAAVPAVRSFGNADVVGKPDRINFMGASNIASTLRAASVLLKVASEWDWFITLSASDYPLITQDDLSHVFSSVRRDLNFIDHTSDLGWKEQQRIQPIVVDPGLYLARRSQIFQATPKRSTPDAFKVFTGSSWVTLSRKFLEYCILGWDNMPRTLLMYFNNVMLPEEGYFHSVICNAPEFMNTTVNSDLRFMIWDNPPKMEPLFLNLSDFIQMAQSGAAFARQFHRDDPVLNLIDEKILNRGQGRVSPGAWCSGRDSWWNDPCSQWGDVNVLRPGPLAKRLGETVTNLMDDLKSQANQCK
ncbi:beta-glucuronosyltransferase GlcAT14A [Punica granatum]|uniref:Beta-glucuronosyltransferase GlcAT14A n=1 Tax=Punica granatum TaxID=22663 RepID=A0A6P8E2V9_PUNGR|nr:beta-glucuronosyltransferase GlcAT14A [Punica granatum]